MSEENIQHSYDSNYDYSLNLEIFKITFTAIVFEQIWPDIMFRPRERVAYKIPFEWIKLKDKKPWPTGRYWGGIKGRIFEFGRNIWPFTFPKGVKEGVFRPVTHWPEEVYKKVMEKKGLKKIKEKTRSYYQTIPSHPNPQPYNQLPDLEPGEILFRKLPLRVFEPFANSNGDGSYPNVCIPTPPPDFDCGEIPWRNITVIRERNADPHGFDGDNDGIGCECPLCPRRQSE